MCHKSGENKYSVSQVKNLLRWFTQIQSPSLTVAQFAYSGLAEVALKYCIDVTFLVIKTR